MSYLSRTRIGARSILFAIIAAGFLLFAMTGQVLAASATEISIDDGGVTVRPGDLFAYTIDFDTSVMATNAIITQSIPSDLEFQSCLFGSPLTGTCTPDQGLLKVQIDPSSLPSGAYTLQTSFLASENLTSDLNSRVELSARDEFGLPLPAATVSITTSVHVPQPRITLRVDDSLTTVQPNDVITYRLTVSNTGDAAAENLLTNFTLPEGVELISATGGIEADVDGIIGWSTTEIAAQNSTELTVSVRVNMPLDPAIVELMARAETTYDSADEPLPSASDVDTLSTVSIIGSVCHDENGNGLRESAESGVEGVMLTASSPNAPDVVVATDSNGHYQFVGMALLPYLIEIDPSTLPEGILAVQESDAVVDGSIGVDMRSGDQPVDANFGFAMPASIQESAVWADMNSDSLRNQNEPGIQFITMTLVYAGVDGMIDTVDDHLFTSSSDSTGDFGFAGLLPGKYRLTVDADSVPNGYKLGIYPQGSGDGAVILSLLAGQTVTGLDFGFGLLDLSVNKNERAVQATTSMMIPYEISYANIGPVDAEQVLVSEFVPDNSTFLPDVSHPGWTCSNGPGAGNRCTLTLGAVPSGDSGTVAFAVVVADNMPARVNAIVNTVQIEDTITVAPDPTPQNNQFVLNTAVEAAPDVTISQTDGGTRTEPGNRLTYAMTYANQGNQAAANVEIVVSVPAYTRFDAAASTPGWSCADGAGPNTTCRLAVGTLEAGAEATVEFAVMLDDTMPVNVATIDSDVFIYADSQEQDRDGELTPLDASPDLILHEFESSPTIQPGDTISFTLNYTNAGNRDAIGVLIVETIPAYTQISEKGSTTGWDCPDGFGAGNRCIFPVGALSATGSGMVSFAVTVDENLPSSIDHIQHRAVIAGSGIEYDIQNNQSSGSVGIEQPTVVDLVEFTAKLQEDDTVLLAWTTSAERNSWGFIVYRSIDQEWDNSLLVTPHLIDALGGETAGATYSFLDETAASDLHYYYWLHELEYNGTTNVYGPIDDAVQGAGPSILDNHIYIPLIHR